MNPAASLKFRLRKLRDRLLSKPQQSKTNTELPNWRALIDADQNLWAEALQTVGGAGRVLIATAVGGHPQLTVLESAVAAALTLRHAKVDVLICDSAMPACLRAKISAMTPEKLANNELKNVFCNSCEMTGRKVFDIPGLDILSMSRWITDEERVFARAKSSEVPLAEIAVYKWSDIPVGEHAMAGALRFYGIGNIGSEPEGEGVLRRYLEAALLTACATRRLLETNEYDVVVTNHGIYAPHGIINAVARSMGVRSVAWNLAYRKQCAIFSHNDTYHHTLMEEPIEAWENMPWDDRLEKEIMGYLDSRRRGSRDWIWFNREADDDMERFAADTGIDWNKPVIGMLTNVVWDAQLHYPANAFPDMLDWVIRTVTYFEKRPDLQLLIRVHPGELAPPGGSTVSRQPVAAEIRKAFKTVPRNVFIIGPESKISTYSAMDKCNAVLIYGTKTGVELTSQGIPVIVGGEAWIRNKGLTLDATSMAEYFSHLDKLPLEGRMSKAATTKARKYAYHFFFRRMLPLPFLNSVPEGWPPYEVAVKKVGELQQGRSAGLDVICDGILKETPFIYKAEELGLHDRQ